MGWVNPSRAPRLKLKYVSHLLSQQKFNNHGSINKGLWWQNTEAATGGVL